MQNFMKHDFIINKIVLSCKVSAGTGGTIHHNRSSHGLAFFVGGDRTFIFEKKKFNVQKNTIVYFPKGSNYYIKEKETSDCYAINFQLPEGVTFEPFSFKVKNLNTYLESFKQSNKVWTKKNTGYSQKVKSELYNIIYSMQSEFDLPYGNALVIKPAVDYILSNYYKENISVSHLASLCKISEVYLRTCFKKTFALSPIKYINNLKMTRAEELLLSNLYSVSEVCFLSGFNDESYFCREFSKRTGVSPNKYKDVQLK